MPTRADTASVCFIVDAFRRVIGHGQRLAATRAQPWCLTHLRCSAGPAALEAVHRMMASDSRRRSALISGVGPTGFSWRAQATAVKVRGAAILVGAGTLSTTHSHSAESTMDRLAARVAQGGVLTIDEAYRQIALNMHLFIYVRLVDDTWKGGARRRYISEIRTLTRAMENGRPVSHLTYSADGTTKQPAGLFPDADFAAELAPFHRDIFDGETPGAV